MPPCCLTCCFRAVSSIELHAAEDVDGPSRGTHRRACLRTSGACAWADRHGPCPARPNAQQPRLTVSLIACELDAPPQHRHHQRPRACSREAQRQRYKLLVQMRDAPKRAFTTARLSNMLGRWVNAKVCGGLGGPALPSERDLALRMAWVNLVWDSIGNPGARAFRANPNLNREQPRPPRLLLPGRRGTRTTCQAA